MNFFQYSDSPDNSSEIIISWCFLKVKQQKTAIFNSGFFISIYQMVK